MFLIASFFKSSRFSTPYSRLQLFSSIAESNAFSSAMNEAKTNFGDMEDSALLYKIAFTFAMERERKESEKVLSVALEKKESEKTFAVMVEKSKNENFNMKSY